MQYHGGIPDDECEFDREDNCLLKLQAAATSISKKNNGDQNSQESAVVCNKLTVKKLVTINRYLTICKQRQRKGEAESAFIKVGDCVCRDSLGGVN